MSEKTYYTFASPEQLKEIGVPESKIVECVLTNDDCQLNEAELTQEQCEELIPEGLYCYSDKEICPFWDIIKEFPKQNNGYCHYLKRGDWQGESGGLLWDQCKECKIKDPLTAEFSTDE